MKIHNFSNLKSPLHSSANSALDSCRSLQTLKQIHATIVVSNGHEPSSVIASKLSSLYISFNDFGSSVSILKNIKEPNIFLWNSIIKAHLDSELVESAFSVYNTMRRHGFSCDSYTFPLLNKLTVLFENGRSLAEMIHCVAMQLGFESDVYFCNTMIEAYVKSECFRNALKVFDEMTHRDLVSWTTMISGYAYEGNANEAFRLFNEMRKDMEPNEVTMIVIVQTCSSMIKVRNFHGYSMKSGFLMDQSLKNSFLKMYADFGSGDDTETLFEEILGKDVISWNILISLYSSKRKIMPMVDCFSTMRGEVEFNIETICLLVSGLKECGNSCPGEQIHCLALKCGLSDEIFWTSLLDYYAKCGNLEMSTQLFEKISQRDSNAWGAMISGLVQNGYFEKAIELSQETVATSVKPAIESLIGVLVACMNRGALRFGKNIHAYSIRNSLGITNKNAQSLETSILNMYVRCGNISCARICFDNMPVKDIVTWTSMIEGCGTHGLGYEALSLFTRMITEGIEPNSVTFLSLLSACSHSGLLHEGCEVLNFMKWKFGSEPDLDHYTCIVDLLGRSGKIKEALSVILKFVFSPDSRIWAVVLSAARIHEDRKIGLYAAKKLVVDFASDNAGYYTLFSNVQASLENWDEVEEVRSVMKDKNLMKHPGSSCLEVGGFFHGFVSGDRSHLEMDEIYFMVECLSRNMQQM